MDKGKSKLKNITFEQAKKVITKDYLKDATQISKSSSNKSFAKPWIFSISLSIFLSLYALMLNSMDKTNKYFIIVLFVWIIPVNAIVGLIISLIKKIELTLFKKSSATMFGVGYISIIIFLGAIIGFSFQSIKSNNTYGLIYYLVLAVFGIWIVFYTCRNVINDYYEEYGLENEKSKFNLFFRKAGLVVVVVGIMLAYVFRMVPGSHGSTAPEFLQKLGVIGTALLIMIVSIMVMSGDIIKGLLIKKYYDSFVEEYQLKEEWYKTYKTKEVLETIQKRKEAIEYDLIDKGYFEKLRYSLFKEKGVDEEEFQVRIDYDDTSTYNAYQVSIIRPQGEKYDSQSIYSPEHYKDSQKSDSDFEEAKTAFIRKIEKFIEMNKAMKAEGKEPYYDSELWN
ncbi:MAG: Imm59 family immunity protein [Streptococcaceae bacterium]|nr:Imm59 family immunity protein [Streptococcaceae bacterium]MCL2681075.1 Imm59 family immunity protein [Streptococcaceae bacterium]